MCAGGGGDAAVTAKTGCGGFRECDVLLYARRFPLCLKGAVYESYARPAILYGSDEWCLKESEIRILEIYKFVVHALFEGSCGSFGYGKQCLLIWSCVEERGWSHLKKDIRF